MQAFSAAPGARYQMPAAPAGGSRGGGRSSDALNLSASQLNHLSASGALRAQQAAALPQPHHPAQHQQQHHHHQQYGQQVRRGTAARRC